MNTVVLLAPEIPQNTGNIARICAVTGTRLHLVGKLGFSLDEKRARRSGLDYWDFVSIEHFEDMDEYMRREAARWTEAEQSAKTISSNTSDQELGSAYLFSTKAPMDYTECNFSAPLRLFFGNESSGAPPQVMEHFRARRALARIPMLPERRSLNLAVSVGIVLYDALRRGGFSGLV